ncbi:MAG: RpiB/LacA/LacB family sugar-phosphate isomerase [Lentimicrobium sp.]|jgi:ribose 5-phosphate isomerase B|nr:RpiB/LacA/LacB family sugar-phosphate isomerase [Lentimicrobium sp.]
MWDKTKIVALASDHAGFELKNFLMKSLTAEGYLFHDFGTNSTASIDYPDVAHLLGNAVNNEKYERGIIICGSGNGVNMVVNKYPEIRSALCWNSEQAELTRRHNNANVLALPGRFIDFNEALRAARLFLNTDFEGGRHETRVNKINKIQL